MDIDLLSRMVKEVILDRDRAVLPGLGTFVAEMVPASFSDRGFTINPPYRRLYFRSRLEEDTSLAEIYSASNNISLDLAQNILTDFLKELRQVLKEKKVVVFPGLGRLRATKENNFFFVPDEDLDIYPEGFGLEPISLKTHSETKEELSAAVENLKSIIADDPEPAETETAPEPELASAELESVPSGPVETEPEPAALEPASESVEAEPAPEPELASAELESVTSGPVETEPEPAALEPVLEPATSETAPEPEPVKKRKLKLGRAAMVAVIVMLFVISLVLIYMILSLLFPGIFDQFLYSDEQLQILEFFSE